MPYEWSLRVVTDAWGLEGWDASAGAGFQYGGGAAAADFDGDGLVDLAMSSYFGSGGLYLNRGSRFEQVPAPAALSEAVSVVGTDIDGDGLSDLVVGSKWGVELLKSVGDGEFESRGWLLESHPDDAVQAGVSVADFDGDQTLDLFACVGRSPRVDGPSQGDRLFRGLGGFQFQDVSAALGPDSAANCFSGTWTDLNRDGWLDLLVVDDAAGPNGEGYDLQNRAFVQRRDDGIYFANEAAQFGLDIRMGAMGAGLGDIDGDGTLEFAVSDVGPVVRTFRLDDGGAVEISASLGTTVGEDAFGLNGWGVQLADLNNDGDDEMLVGFGGRGWNSNSMNFAFENHLWAWDEGELHLRTPEIGCGTSSHWRNPVIADFDFNGVLDIVFTSFVGRACMVTGQARGHHALQVALAGPPGNREGHGARIDITLADGSSQTQWIAAGSNGVHSSRQPIAHFGLGTHEEVEELIVTWPHGHVVELTDVPADQRITVDEY